MAERRKKKQRAREADSDGVSKEETAVGKYLRFNVPTKKTSIMRNNVEYFTASKAVDSLLDSKWAEGKGKTEVLFTHRESAVNYCQRLLEKGMFYRAKKMVKKEEKKKKDEKKTEEKKEGKKEKTKEKEKEKEGEKEKTKEKPEEEDTETSGKKEAVEEPASREEEGVEDTPSGKKKKEVKRKMKLEFHEEQIFLDGNELYVWVFDPIHPKTFALGLALVVAAVIVVLFPLWPYEARQGVYYLSLAAAFFIGFILFLAVVRLILFCLIWAGTGGHHHFWFLPNLTADVGFLDSFRPLYLYEYKGPDKDKGKKEDQKDSEKETEPQGEREDEHVEELERKEKEETTEKGEEEAESPKDQDGSGSEKDANDESEEDEQEGSEDEEASESEDQDVDEQGAEEEGNGGGSDTANGDNGFEVIKKEELEVEGLGDKGQGDVTQTQD